MRHIRLDGQWLEFIGGLLATPLMALPADRIALQLTESFGLVGASYELRAPGRAPQRQLWPLEERFGGHRAEIEQWGPQRVMDCHPIARYYLATGDPAVIQVSEVPDRFADRHVSGRGRSVPVSGGACIKSRCPCTSVTAACATRRGCVGRR